ncbi:MAG: hypothetical protein WD602_02745 [Actinomycetota bacterium]
MTEHQTPKRRRRLSAQDRWTIFQEVSAKDAKVARTCAAEASTRLSWRGSESR